MTAPQPVERSLSSRFRALMVDTRPLRENRPFRLVFTGQGISFLGTMFTAVLLPYQVYELTHSSLAVGLMGLAEVVPVLATAMLGGTLADRVDRRRMIALCELALALVTAGLLLNALQPEPQLWALYAAAAAMSAIEGLQRPSLDALIPQLLPPDQLSAGAALNSIRMGIGFTVAPALAGLTIAGFGVPMAYAIDLLTFLASLWALSLFNVQPPAPDEEKLTLNSVRQGIRYATSRRDLLGTYVIDFGAMVFGTPIALFPQIADEFGGPGTLGLLYTAPAVGTLLVSVSSGWANRFYRRGRVIVVSAALWGVSMACLGLAESLWVALLVLCVGGALDGVSMVFRSTMWNESIPDRYRGRLAGLELVSVSTGPAIGNTEAGAVASAFNLRTSIVSGGLIAAAVTVAVAVAYPSLWRYDARDHLADDATPPDRDGEPDLAGEPDLVGGPVPTSGPDS